MDIQIYISIIAVLLGIIINYLIKIKILKAKKNKLEEITLSLKKIEHEGYDKKKLLEELEKLLEKMKELENNNQIKIKSVDRKGLKIKFSRQKTAANNYYK